MEQVLQSAWCYFLTGIFCITKFSNLFSNSHCVCKAVRLYSLKKRQAVYLPPFRQGVVRAGPDRSRITESDNNFAQRNLGDGLMFLRKYSAPR